MPWTLDEYHDIKAANPTAFGSPSAPKVSPDNYSSWNGDWYGFLNYKVAQGDADSADKLINYLMSEESADKARKWTAQREDTQYQRLVSDLKAAGINPYVLLQSSGSPVSSSSSGNSYSGSQFTSRAAALETERHNKTQDSLKILGSLLSVLAVMAAVVL